MSTPELLSQRFRTACARVAQAVAVPRSPASARGSLHPRARFVVVCVLLSQAMHGAAAAGDDWVDWNDDVVDAAAGTAAIEPRPHLPVDPAAGGPPVPALGERLDAEETAALPTTIYPDGRGLPPGSGTAAEGAALFAGLCAQCHGPEGIGGSAPELAGGRAALDSEYPDQNIGTYWPHATTIFDFLRRSMPMFAPGSLEDDHYYALTAWLLERNGLWPSDQPLDAAGLASVKMPNRDGFDSYWPDHGVQP
jgi:S-disulfanyl-L-cysteine oxidoreductase SoxD